MPVETYRSKIDSWLVVLLFAPLVIVLFVIAKTGPASAEYLGGTVLSAVAAFNVWILLATDYRLSDDHLRVRSGPFRWTVPIAQIRKVTPTRSPLSSPALSLDRLLIEYGRMGAVMISPKERERFLEALEKRRTRTGAG